MSSFPKRTFLSGAAVLTLGINAAGARAEIIGGVEFPQGALSFADAVVSYQHGR